MKVTTLTESTVRLDLVGERDASAVEAMTPRTLFDRYASFVWRTLKYQSVADRDLDDVSQEVFLVVFRKLPEFEAHGSVRAWIYGVCIRVAADYRKRARHRHEILVSETPDGAIEPVASLEMERSAARQALTAMIQRLDEDKRAVLVLHEIENLPMTEVALIVDCPLKTAYSRLAAARKQMLVMLSKSKLSER